MARMIGFVAEAKKLNDEYLTDLIEKEKQKLPSKKPKV